MLIVQISDLHVAAGGGNESGPDAAANLARCVRHITRLALRPDVVLATGDLVDGGTPAEYHLLRKLLAPLRMPVYVIPGNHDDRNALRKAFFDHGYLGSGDGPIHYAVDHHELGLIALDTTIPSAEGGALERRQMEWFGATLERMTHHSVLVFMHHPPIKTGIQCMDDIALDDASAARLGVIVSCEPRVERIVCGHVHRSIQARWNGTLVSICPSTAFQSVLGLGGEPFDAARDEPPAYQLHYWNGAELITHTVPVGMSA